MHVFLSSHLQGCFNIKWTWSREISPGKSLQKRMGRKQKEKREDRKTTEAKQSKKTGKAVKVPKDASDQSLNEGQECIDAEDDSLSVHKEVTKNQDERSRKTKQVDGHKPTKEPKKTKKEETQSLKQALKGRQGKVSTPKEPSIGVTEKGCRTAKPKQFLKKPEGRTGQTTSKPAKFLNRKKAKVVEIAEEESEESSSERENVEVSEDGKEEESECVEESAPAELSEDSSEETDRHRRADGECEEDGDERDGRTGRAPEESSRRVTGRTAALEKPASSEEELLTEEELSDGLKPETSGTDLLKNTRTLNMTSERLGQKIAFKSKMLQKKEYCQTDNPDEGPSVSKALKIKGLGLKKADAAKGKSQILQLANKTKSITKTEKDQNPEGKVSAARGPKSLFTRQSCAMLTMKGKGKDNKASQDVNEEATKAKETGEDVKGEQAPGQTENLKPVEKDVKLTSKATRLRGMTTLRRMSGWVQKKIPRGSHVQRKVRAVTQAIGASKWLVVQISRKKSSSSSCKKNLFQQRMVMRVASRRTRQKNAKEEIMSQENTVDGQSEDPISSPCEIQSGQDEKTNAGDAKYAIVFPRMNKIGQCQGNTPTPASRGTGDVTVEPRPPKPGARLVLPGKPDLSVLKSIKKNVPESQPSRNENTEDKEERVTLNNSEGASVLQAAKDKLGSSQFKLTKLSLSKPIQVGGLKPAQGKDGEERDRNMAAPSAGSEGHRQALVSSIYEEEADREVAQLMGDSVFSSPPDVHWALHDGTFGDPQDWLRTESLLPHQTVEKLTKWTVYQDDDRAQTIHAHNGSGPWESEDPTQNMLESKLNSTQVQMCT